MHSSSKTCQPGLLEQSLKDELTDQQEECLAEHLSHCEACRRRLHLLAGTADDWSEVTDALSSVALDLPSPNENGEDSQPEALSRVRSTGSHPADIDPVDFAVSFLDPAAAPDTLGRLNNIEIQSVIGRGGNGIVLKGFQEELNRPIAVKVMSPHLATSAAARQRFAREAQATAAIVHPNVMPVLTVHSDSQLPYLVMPFVDCESLQERLDQRGWMTPIDVLRISYQVAEALAAAHAQGLVHRDVKPANILLDRNVDRVMLTDFGLARAVDDATLTRSGLIPGTPQYMSPEQARGEAVDTASDLFSLGSVMYAMSTGRPPFRAETSYGILKRVADEIPRPIRQLNGDIPDWLENLVRCLMEKRPENRLQSASEIARLLRECVAHLQHPSVNKLPVAVADLKPKRRISLVQKICLTIGISACAVLGWSMTSVMNAEPLRGTSAGLLLARTTMPPGTSIAGNIAGTTRHPDDEPPSEVIGNQYQPHEAWESDLIEDIESLNAQVETLLDSVHNEF